MVITVIFMYLQWLQQKSHVDVTLKQQLIDSEVSDGESENSSRSDENMSKGKSRVKNVHNAKREMVWFDFNMV